MSTTPGPAPLVLHLNGRAGVGKSTLARRWAECHPGTLLLDIDALRTWVSGWRDDFAATGAAVRPAALAMLSAYVAEGGSVVLPQLIANESELARFEAAAHDAGGRFVEVFLESEDLADRFAARQRDEPGSRQSTSWSRTRRPTTSSSTPTGWPLCRRRGPTRSDYDQDRRRRRLVRGAGGSRRLTAR